MADLAFVDTETTSLRHDRRAWEVGMIVREPGELTDTEHRWFVDSCDLDLGNADLFSLNIGRYHGRHPDVLFEANPAAYARDVAQCRSEREVMHLVEAATRGAHLVGAVVSFDADVLGQRMRAHGICPSWHHHLIDVEALAVGYLAGLPGYGVAGSSRPVNAFELIRPPWKSDDLSAALGVTVSEEDRHTALGDARFALRIYDAVMGGTP